MVQISLQNSGGTVIFLGGSMEPSPLGHQQEWKYNYHLGPIYDYIIPHDFRFRLIIKVKIQL